MDFRKKPFIQKLWREKSQYADKLESRLHARSGLTENSNYLKRTGRSNVAATGAYTSNCLLYVGATRNMYVHA